MAIRLLRSTWLRSAPPSPPPTDLATPRSLSAPHQPRDTPPPSPTPTDPATPRSISIPHQPRDTPLPRRLEARADSPCFPLSAPGAQHGPAAAAHGGGARRRHLAPRPDARRDAARRRPLVYALDIYRIQSRAGAASEHRSWAVQDLIAGSRAPSYAAQRLSSASVGEARAIVDMRSVSPTGASHGYTVAHVFGRGGWCAVCSVHHTPSST